MTEEKYDPVNHPAHYTQYKREVIELTEQMDFCLGNAVKYVLRAPFKGNKIQDWEKAVWYLKRWAANNRDDGRAFDTSMWQLADTYDDKCLNALFHCRTVYDGVQAAIDFLEKEIDFAAHEALEKENERLKATVSALKLKAADLERQLAEERKRVCLAPSMNPPGVPMPPYDVTFDARPCSDVRKEEGR